MNTVLLLVAMLTAVGAAAKPAVFDDLFSDSTLRVDYTLGGMRSEPVVLLDGAKKFPGWAGRRTHLSELPLHGNLIVTVTDVLTADTIYRNSGSDLFMEWLATDEAAALPRSFENVQLMPLPRRAADVHLTLFDPRRRPIAEHTFRYEPSDVLVAGHTAATLPHRVIHRAASDADAIDVVLLAEGYRVEEMDSFYRHVRLAVDEILSYEPFRRYAHRFNFVAVASPSADSGVSVPRLGLWRDTAFGSHFSTFYSDRYLTAPRQKAVHDALVGIPYEHIIVLANTDEYGGGGIYNNYLLTTTRHRDFCPVVVHEFGHSFAGLADEYFYDGDVMEDSYPVDVEPWEPNITTLVDFDSKWKHMLPPGTPVPTPQADARRYPTGVYEGGGYSSKGVYRPADECRMRNNSYPTFCPVCEAAIERMIRFYTR